MIMKKYFIFAAVATAGLFASCSSSDDFVANEAQNPAENSDDVAIVLNVSQPVSAEVTRGTGTVGGILDADNLWDGEHVNVYMFNKGTFTVTQDGQGGDLFNNTEMRAPLPSTTATGQVQEYVLSDFEDPGNPGKTYIKHRYYPATGNYDFWAYHLDDAVAAGGSTPVVGTNDITVPFKIDGSQDLMVAAAWPSATELTTLGTTEFYKAASARKGVHPNLLFQHLLTRLTFTVKGGNAQACGWTLSDPADPASWTAPVNGDTYRGIFVKSIKVYSKQTGNMVAAYNYWDDTNAKPEREKTDLISWDYTGTYADGYDAYTAAEAAGTALPTDVVPFYLKGKKDKSTAAVAEVLYTNAEVDDLNAALTNALSIDNTALDNLADADAVAAANAKLQGAIDNSGTHVLTADEATAMNAVTPAPGYTGTIAAGETVSASDADKYNATLDGALSGTGGDVAVADAKAYNLHLPGATAYNAVKTPAVPAHDGTGKLLPLYDMYDATENPTGYFKDNDKEGTWIPALVIGSTHHAEIYKPTTAGTTAADLEAGAKPVGSALLVSPETSYKMVVELGQLVLDLSVPTAVEPGETPGNQNKYECVFTELPPLDLTIAGGFLPGTSYNVVLTAYSNTEIIINATLENWASGGDVDVPLE